jgi:hypothetical protein
MSFRGAVFSEYLKINGRKYILAPKNLCIAFVSLGKGIEVTENLLSSDNEYDPPSQTYPKKLTLFTPKVDLDNFR